MAGVSAGYAVAYGDAARRLVAARLVVSPLTAKTHVSVPPETIYTLCRCSTVL